MPTAAATCRAGGRRARGAVRRRQRAAVPEPRRGGVDQRPAGGRRAGARSSCRGTRACTGAPATSPGWPPAAYEQARAAALGFAGRPADGDDVAIICRNTTEAINHLAYRLRLQPDDVVVTTVVEHHANLLPWARLCQRRFVECGPDGTFDVDDVTAALDAGPAPRCWPSPAPRNVTGWLPPLDAIIDAAHDRGVPVLVDAAQLAAHRPLPAAADYLAWSGHKMYAPFGAGVLIGPRATFAEGDPFLAGGGAVDLVDLDEVVWTDPPEREEAGSPNVIGAVALARRHRRARPDRLGRRSPTTTTTLARRLRGGLAGLDGVALLGPDPTSPTLPLAAFTVEGVPHALVAARLSAEYGIGVRHGCFCAHPYLMRLLDLSAERRSPPTGRRAPRRPRAGSPARCGPAPGFTPARPTSTGSSPRSPTSPAAGPPPSPTSRTRPPATTGPKATRPGGPQPTGPSARPAPAADWPPPATTGPPAVGLALAVIAHPDDESFGLGSVLTAMVDAGTRVAALCFTHGESVHPRGRRRRPAPHPSRRAGRRRPIARHWSRRTVGLSRRPAGRHRRRTARRSGGRYCTAPPRRAARRLRRRRHHRPPRPPTRHHGRIGCSQAGRPAGPGLGCAGRSRRRPQHRVRHRLRRPDSPRRSRSRSWCGLRCSPAGGDRLSSEPVGYQPGVVASAPRAERRTRTAALAPTSRPPSSIRWPWRPGCGT